MDKETIRKIIELTASVDDEGMVWGFDTEINHIDNLINRAEDIIKQKELKNGKTKAAS